MDATITEQRFKELVMQVVTEVLEERADFEGRLRCPSTLIFFAR
jgi:hypothetical protein